jgi:predicted nucleic acid-binding protein
MIVISDTSPLNYLVLIGQDRVLPILFDRVAAPPAVVAELSHHGSPRVVRDWVASPPAWLEILTPAIIDSALGLGAGETEAIGLARELHADAVLIDERKAAKVASRLGLAVTGTLGVLDLAAEKRILDFGLAIAALRQTTFRGPEDLIDMLLRRDTLRRPASAD